MMQKVFGGVLVALGLVFIVGVVAVLWLLALGRVSVEHSAFGLAAFFTIVLGLFSIMAGAFLSGWEG